MAIAFGALTRPTAHAEMRSRSRYRSLGLIVAAAGLGLATVSLINSVIAGSLASGAGAADQVASLGAWSFGLTTAAFGTVKLAIGLVLLGIVRQIWLRVESVKASLPSIIRAQSGDRESLGEYESEFGPASATAATPEPLLIHRTAGALWAPMLAMGVMLVYAGFVLSLGAAGNVTSDPALAASQRAWVQGIQFLGEGFLLSGISFLLGTILGAIRAGGGEVQESLRVTVWTLRTPTTAKLFVALMMLGLMVEIGQFVGYAYVATIPGTPDYSASSTWLGPLREFGLGVLLSGIVLALATIAKALGFQFARITQLITSGR